jgi:hypothetical protein
MTKPLPTRPGRVTAPPGPAASTGTLASLRTPETRAASCVDARSARAKGLSATDAVNYAAELLCLRRADYVTPYGTKGSTAVR